MADLERNQLKRGRMSGKSSKNLQTSEKLGEIIDPKSVLNDSIAQKQVSKSQVQEKHISVEKEPVVKVEKTTSVDEIENSVSKERTQPSRSTKFKAEEGDHRRSSGRSESKKFDNSKGRQNSYPEHSEGKSAKRKGCCCGNKKPGEKTKNNGKCAHKCPCSSLWSKILRFFGFNDDNEENCHSHKRNGRSKFESGRNNNRNCD